MVKAEGDGGLLSRWGVKEAHSRELRSQAWKEVGGKSASLEEPAGAKALERACFRQKAGVPEWRVVAMVAEEAGPGGWGRRGLEAEVDELVIRLPCLLGGLWSVSQELSEATRNTG